MSSVGRKVVDWLSVSQALPTAARGELAYLKKTYDDLRAKMATTSAATAIDWEYYKRTIKTPELVELFKKQLQSVDPTLDENPELVKTIQQNSASLSSKEKEIMESTKDFVKMADKRLAELQKELAELERAKPIDEITVDEIMREHPEWQEHINKDICEHKW